MKLNFKKIATVLGSALMVGSTMGLAAAANYPAPFVQSGAGDVAVVIGANSADMSYATTIAQDLSPKITTGASTIIPEGSDLFKLEKSSDKFYINEALNSSYTSLDADELKSALADGIYDSEDIEDVDYEQSITLGSNVLSLFTDSKYNNKEPTVGFKFANGDTILSYTIDFDDSEVNMTKMVESDMPLLGNDYYVLTTDTTADKIELLDSANTVILEDGSSTVVNGKTVSIDWIDTNEVILNVDGSNIKKLSEGGVAKLSDGSYVSIKNILSSTRESVTQKVEFSIGSGKIILENGKEVIMGQDSDDKIRGLYATVTESGGFLNAITLTWNSKDTTFVTPQDSATMSGFGAFSLVFNGLNYASDSETITLQGGSETLTLEMGNFNIPLMWFNGTDFIQGEEDYPLIIADGVITNETAGYTGTETTPWGEIYNVSTQNISSSALALQEEDRFIVTLLDEDLSDVETLYYQVSEIDVDGADVLVELDDLIGSRDLKWSGTIVSKVGDTDEAGDVTVKLAGFNAANDTVYLEFTNGVSFNKIVSEKGLVVTLPTTNASAITFREADKDEDVNQGATFAATVSASTNNKISVTLASNNVTKVETLSDDKYTALVLSELATKINTDESGDEYDLEIEYTGKEAIANVLVSESATSSGSGSGLVAVRDTELTSTDKDKNLIVVGGSCINQVAASLLGSSVPMCGAEWEAKTGAGAGKFIIQSFASPYSSSKTALLVAGYDLADTQKAVTYLVNKPVDTTIGKKYAGTSATEATLVV